MCVDVGDVFFLTVAKPLVADGSANSHAMSLAYSRCGLPTLETPLVLQEFVNHGTYRLTYTRVAFILDSCASLRACGNFPPVSKGLVGLEHV